MDPDPNKLSDLLQGAMRSNDACEWPEFVNNLMPLIAEWAGANGLPGEDTDDVIQDVLIVLLNNLRKFQQKLPDNFCAWLKTIVGRVCTKRLHAKKPVLSPAAVEQAPARDPPEAKTQPQHDPATVQPALEAIRGDFREKTWLAFHRLTVEEQPAAEVAADLGMTIPAVWAAKHRVLRRLREEIERRSREK